MVTVNNNRREIGHDEAQDADHVTLMRQFTKSTRFVPEPANVVAAAREAFRVALSGNPGPAHIDFARDAVETGELIVEPRSPGRNRPLSRPVAAAADVEAAAERLARAEQPVIWAGRGVIGSDATGELVALAEAMGAPVITTYNGISAFPGRHELSLGARSKWGGRPANAALAEADLVLAVGNSLNSISTSRWTLRLPDLVQIDCDPTSIGKRYPVAVSVLGDARDALARLARGCAAAISPVNNGRPGCGGSSRCASNGAPRSSLAPAQIASPVKPLFVMQTLAEVFDDNTILVYDAGNAGIWAQTVPVQRPRHYMKPVGYGAMGFALPAAIASKITRPDPTVVCIIGDGSLAMSLGEIETAVREQAPVIVIVFNDRAFGNIKQLQLKQFGQRHVGVDVGDLRFADVAKAMGAGRRAGHLGHRARRCVPACGRIRHALCHRRDHRPDRQHLE